MAKGDSTSPGPSGQAQGMNPKMDQYSVMHHLMTQLGQGGQSIGPSQNFGQKFGGGGQMGGALGAAAGPIGNMATSMYGSAPQNGNQWEQAGAPQMGLNGNIGQAMGQAGLMAGSMMPQFQQPQQQRMRPQFSPQSGMRQQMMGNNVA